MLFVHFPDSSSDDLSGILVIGCWKRCGGLNLGRYPTQIYHCVNCVLAAAWMGIKKIMSAYVFPQYRGLLAHAYPRTSLLQYVRETSLQCYGGMTYANCEIFIQNN